MKIFRNGTNTIIHHIANKVASENVIVRPKKTNLEQGFLGFLTVKAQAKKYELKRNFSTVTDKAKPVDEEEAVVKIASKSIERWDFSNELYKAQTESRLKDGSKVTIRRPGPEDINKLCVFVKNARFGIFDYLATTETTADAVCDYLANVSVENSSTMDTLIALQDDKIVGVSTYESRPGEMEEPINYSALKECGYTGEKLCVAKTVILPGMQGKGVGSVLKHAQMKNALESGYDAIISNSSREAVKKIIKNSGGKFSNGWTFISLNENASEN